MSERDEAGTGQPEVRGRSRRTAGGDMTPAPEAGRTDQAGPGVVAGLREALKPFATVGEAFDADPLFKLAPDGEYIEMRLPLTPNGHTFTISVRELRQAAKALALVPAPLSSPAAPLSDEECDRIASECYDRFDELTAAFRRGVGINEAERKVVRAILAAASLRGDGVREAKDCPRCAGSGYVNDSNCPECCGLGKVEALASPVPPKEET